MTHLKIRRLPARYGVVLMPFFLSILMCAVVSFIATLKTVGLAAGVLPLGLGAWLTSWLIAFPTLLLALPLVRRLVAMLVETAPRPR